jgi:hypothetical protein
MNFSVEDDTLRNLLRDMVFLHENNNVNEDENNNVNEDEKDISILSIQISEYELKEKCKNNEKIEILYLPSDFFQTAQDEKCCICLENDVSTKLLPCSHDNMCGKCLDTLIHEQNGYEHRLKKIGEVKCPVCRGCIETVIKNIS